MYKRELALLTMIMLSSISWSKSPSVKVLQKAIACNSIGDFDPFFKVQYESKETQSLSTPPANCIFIDAGVILRGPLKSEDREFYNKKHTFFLIQQKSDNQKRWIPDYLVKPL